MTGQPERTGSERQPERMWWPTEELPTGTLLVWRGDMSSGVREVQFVPRAEAEALAEALEAAAARLDRYWAAGDAKAALDVYRSRHPKETP